MQAAGHRIRGPAHGGQIVRLNEDQAFLRGKAFAGNRFVEDAVNHELDGGSFAGEFLSRQDACPTFRRKAKMNCVLLK